MIVISQTNLDRTTRPYPPNTTTTCSHDGNNNEGLSLRKEVVMSLKKDLLTSASQQTYYNLAPSQLEELWTASNHFVDTQRLTCLEIEWYPLLEQHFYLSILTCRDAVAKLMLTRIMEKFGENSRRVYKMRTAYVRATQENEKLEKHLSNLNQIEYDAHKIGMVSLKAAGNYKAYIQALADYLEQNPVDAEAWAEFAEAYAHVGDYENAVSSLEQVLIIEPLAYNIFARIGELKRLQAVTAISKGFAAAKELTSSSLDHLCRAVELNPLYLRGWCGVYIVSNISQEPQAESLNAKARAIMEKLVKSKIGQPEEIEAATKILGFS